MSLGNYIDPHSFTIVPKVSLSLKWCCKSVVTYFF